MEPKSNIVTRFVVTSVRLPENQHRQLKDIAAREHRTVSQQVRHMIEHWDHMERAA